MLLQTNNYKVFQVGSTHFEDFRLANHCLPGDTVEWKDKCILQKRGIHRFIPGVLELNSKYIYGYTSRNVKIYLFHPHDRKYPPFRVGSKCNTMTNQLGLIEFMEWEDHETMPRGNLIRLLGPCGDLEKEKEALTYQYSQPQLAKELFDIEDVNLTDRFPLDGFTFNIDPDGCLDIDDVFTLKQLSDTRWQFVITISDVAAHIPAGSIGDNHALTLGQTLYQNGEAVVPMLPAPISEMALSLRAHETHTGISLFCEWSTVTKTLAVKDFKETIFKNNWSFSYESVYKAEEFPLSVLQDIASYLKGAVTQDSHEWVAEAMILYNKEVAKKLVEHGTGILRTHQPADLQKLNQFLQIHPDLKALAYEAAKYECTGPGLVHATLGSVPYCHASSPIRRYADLMNQRSLKAILHKESCIPIDPSVVTQLNVIQKRMRAYERALFFLEQVQQAPSGSIQGFVFSCTQEKTKVYIPSWKHMITLEPGSYTIGQPIQIQYYANLQKPYWEQRMVFTTKVNEDANRDE